MIIVDNPISKVFSFWGSKIKDEVGDGHYSMDSVVNIASLPYASMTFMGMPSMDGDLEGNEASATLSVQIECYANGKKSLSKVFAIDAVSHQAMIDMGFRRMYGPEMVDALNTDVKRVISRYSMLYTGYLLNEE